MNSRIVSVPLIPIFALSVTILLTSPDARAAIGCTLSNPAQDLKYLFPEMTSYKEEVRDLSRMKNGKAIYGSLRERLGSDLDPMYESFETPYTIYTIFRGSEVIGYVHGVNVPGRGGLIQVFLSMDPQTGSIRRMFYQRLESRAAQALRSKEFLDQFKSLTLADFYRHEYYRVIEPGSKKDVISRIQNPIQDERSKTDFYATLRAVRKNLILMDFFVYQNQFEPLYQEVKAELDKMKNSSGGLR